MARRFVFRPQRLTTILGVVVLGLGILCLYAVTHGASLSLSEAASDRAVRQIREQKGSRAELRYAEAGRGRALCGYAGLSGRTEAIAFVSRPNRILFDDDPLPGEFREMQTRFCPGFLRNPVSPVS